MGVSLDRRGCSVRWEDKVCVACLKLPCWRQLHVRIYTGQQHFHLLAIGWLLSCIQYEMYSLFGCLMLGRRFYYGKILTACCW
jgi:hypothetical protein